jgi:hypothetical protein
LQIPLVNASHFCRDSFLGIGFIESKKPRHRQCANLEPQTVNPAVDALDSIQRSVARMDTSHRRTSRRRSNPPFSASSPRRSPRIYI